MRSEGLIQCKFNATKRGDQAKYLRKILLEMASSSSGGDGCGASPRRKVLSLEERNQVVQMKQAGKSCRKIAEEFGVGKTQIQNIIRNKYLIEMEIANGCNVGKKYVKAQKTRNEDLNSSLWQWFCDVRSRNIPVTGKLLQEKARWLAVEQSKPQFKASNGWLESFKKRNNIQLAVLSNKIKDENESVLNDWTKCLPSLCEGYSPANIFNVDETGLFYRALPSDLRSIQGKTNRYGKRSQERISVLLCCSATGEKLNLFVVGKSQSPSCFRGKTISNLYAANKNSWMTSSLFKIWLDKLNTKMKMEGRTILLFLDRCTAHPEVELTNVKLQFFPANTPAKLKPFDVGIIRALKATYRTLLLQHVMFHLDANVKACDIAKKIHLLDAISWLQSAWETLNPQTISNCFNKCHFYPNNSPAAQKFTEVKFEIPDDVSLILGDISWEDFVTMDDATLTKKHPEDYWLEEEVLGRNPILKANNSDDEEEEGQEESCREVISCQVASGHLEDLKLFAFVHEDQEILEFVGKCQQHLESKWEYYKKNPYPLT